jgi:hypothetical protein
MYSVVVPARARVSRAPSASSASAAHRVGVHRADVGPDEDAERAERGAVEPRAEQR